MKAADHGKKQNKVRLWAVLVWLLIWQYASMALGEEILLVSPVRVLLRLKEMIVTADFWQAAGFSVSRIAGGFLLAVAAACLMAALSARYDWIRDLLAPAVLAVRSIPVASFIILALIWFSSENLSVLISFLMVFPVMYANVLDGIRSCDPRLLEVAAVFSMSPYRRIRYIYMPQVFPFFMAGAAVSSGLCWKAGVAAEVIGMPTGSIGEKLQQAKVYLDTPDLFAWTLVIVLISVAFERGFLYFCVRLKRRVETV